MAFDLNEALTEARALMHVEPPPGGALALVRHLENRWRGALALVERAHRSRSAGDSGVSALVHYLGGHMDAWPNLLRATYPATYGPDGGFQAEVEVATLRGVEGRKWLAPLLGKEEPSPAWPLVRSLTFKKMRLSAGELAQALASPLAEPLRRLSFQEQPLKPDDLRALTQSSVAPRLLALDIAQSKLDPQGARLLAQPSLSGLLWLNVPRNELDNEGAAALVQFEPWARLHGLDLSSNGIENAGFRSLSRATHLSSLAWLSLSCNTLGNLLIRTLERAPQLGRLRSLDLSACDLTGEGLRSLFEIPLLADLDTLCLGYNPGMTNATLGHLAHAAPFPKLTHLDLQSCPLDLTALGELARSTQALSLKLLDLRGNPALKKADHKAVRALPGFQDTQILI
jgi:hypothetical protein